MIDTKFWKLYAEVYASWKGHDENVAMVIQEWHWNEKKPMMWFI